LSLTNNIKSIILFFNFILKFVIKKYNRKNKTKKLEIPNKTFFKTIQIWRGTDTHAKKIKRTNSNKSSTKYRFQRLFFRRRPYDGSLGKKSNLRMYFYFFDFFY
jgi:hypothetical protein